MIYCTNSTKAIITFTTPDGKQEIVRSNNPPITITCNFIPSETFSHSMTSAIGRSFSHPVKDIRNTGGSWSPRDPARFNDSLPYISCPTTSSNPFKSTGYDPNNQTDSKINISGNSISCNFDFLYNDNVGVCTYEVIFGYAFKIEDASGIIYSNSYDICPQFTVACGDECPAGQERIPTLEYPGYKCRDRCPPETCCECDSGDVICCYGSQGQVLKTISK